MIKECPLLYIINEFYTIGGSFFMFVEWVCISTSIEFKVP